MKQKEQKHPQSRQKLWVRIMALAMSLLVTGGVLTYIVMFIMSFFETAAHHH